MRTTASWLWVFALAACGNKAGPNNGSPDAEVVVDATTGCNATSCPPTQFCATSGACIDAGTCATDEDCGGGMKCNTSTHTCEIAGCGGQLLNLEYVRPNFLIVLDRSCSMSALLAGTVTSKWAAAVDAINTATTTYENDLQWGLTMFPDKDGANCSQATTLPFPLGPNNAPTIRAALTAALVVGDPNYPNGPCVTNIDTGITQAATDPGLNDATRPSYVMLISDGAQSNGCNVAGGNVGTEAAIADLKNTRGIPTFVVGFGSGTSATTLTTLANAGGTARANTPAYYQADTAAQLEEAFQQIADLIVSCEYTLAPAPTNIDLTFVYYNNTESVPRDSTHTSGWDYDPATMKLTFYGSHCDRLQDRSVTDVDVVYGCDMPPVD